MYLGIHSLGVSFLSDLSTSFFFLIPSSIPLRASLIAQLVKNLLAMQETPVRLLGREDPLEKG